MKKLKKFLLISLVLVATTNYAQTNKYGIRAGVGIPNLKSTDNNIYSKDYESVTGFDGSLFADFGITEEFSIKAELGFLRKGGERNGWQPIPAALLVDPATGEPLQLPPGVVPYATFDNKAVFSYIEIPVLAKYEWSLGETWGVYVNAGPYIDFMINPKQKTKGESSIFIYSPEAGDYIPITPPMSFEATTDISKDLATIDFGAMYGIGVTAAISEHSELLFDVRGSYGFLPLQNDKDTYGTVHMGSLSFALGYAYTFPSKVQKTPVKQ
ncbi:PorT family protein [Lutibacter sp. HS1-25]|uniref:porin family protein n=1 Tax=Lutibacter sp. HS1-25 TaxID=2485000 RepID=UPI00101239FE|nr:porin family protein [Lutibacter sp. HS1-25]RXP57648.1 PorT family protein [Lutibacter sp. HS1-25]